MTFELNNPKNYLYTHDLGCCTALMSAGFELAGFDNTNPSQVLFVFTRTPELNQAEENYWADTLEVKARTLFNNTKMLKSRIRNSYGGAN
ncbi:MAG: DUF5659 domain-containing protein [Patescibacteria group bacterium]|jgi:hypothetical protein